MKVSNNHQFNKRIFAFWGCVVGLLFLLVVVVATLRDRGMPQENKPNVKPKITPVKSDTDQAVGLVEEWLQEQRNGGDGLRFFRKDSLDFPRRFLVLQSWEIKRASVSDPFSYHGPEVEKCGSVDIRVRCKDSTNDYRVYMVKINGRWKLTAVN